MFADTMTTTEKPYNEGRHPDNDIAIKLIVGNDAAIYIFHDKPFTKSLSWLEFDLNRSSLDFIMDDGDIRNFGIPVDPTLKPYMQNVHSVGVVLAERLENVIGGEVLPLIVHRP